MKIKKTACYCTHFNECRLLFDKAINILTKKIPFKYKNIFFLLLWALISFSCLFAQSSKIALDFSNNKTTQYSNIEVSLNEEIERQEESAEKHQVTVSEYVDFLNAVAVDDTHHLYDERMGLDSDEACITRIGSPGSYSYSVINARGGGAITYVSWFNQARFCNWLENGKPIGVQNSETTEDGSYTFSDASDNIILLNQGSTCFLPNNNENEIQDNFQNFDESQNDLNPLLKFNIGFCIVLLKTPDPILMGGSGFMGITTMAVRYLFNRYTTRSFVGLGRTIEVAKRTSLMNKSVLGVKSSTGIGFEESIIVPDKSIGNESSFTNLPLTREVEPPVILDEDAEEIGMVLLNKLKRVKIKGLANDQNSNAVIAPIIGPTKLDYVRWKAREEADRLAMLALSFWHHSQHELHNPAKENIKDAENAEKEWIDLAKQAEKGRISNGGVVFDSEKNAIDAWKKADRFAVEKCNWNANVTRWVARLEADKLAIISKNIQDKAKNFSKKGSLFMTLHGEDPLALSIAAAQAVEQAQKAEENWSQLADLDKDVREANLKGEAVITSFKEEIKQLDRTVNKLWDPIEVGFQEYISYKKSSESKIKEFSKKKESYLKEFFEEADRMIKEAKEKYNNINNPNHRTESKKLYNEVDRLEKIALEKYVNAVMNDSLEFALERVKKNIYWFEEAWKIRLTKTDENLKIACEAYDNAKIDKNSKYHELTLVNKNTEKRIQFIESTKKAVSTYDSLTRKSKKYIPYITKGLDMVAPFAPTSIATPIIAASTVLKIAEANIPNISQKDQENLSEISQDLTTVFQKRQATVKGSLEEIQSSDKDNWADNDWRGIQRMNAIAKIDEESFDAFKDNVTTLVKIRMTWITNWKNAVKNYMNGNSSEWLALTQEERSIYNAAAKVDNKDRNDAIQRKIQDAEVKATENRNEANRINNALLVSNKSKDDASEAAEKSELALERLKDDDDARKKAIRWAKFTLDERKAERKVKSEYALQSVKLAEKEINKSWDQIYGQQERVKYWILAVKAQEKNETLAILWQQAAEACEKSITLYQRAMKQRAQGNKNSKIIWNDLHETSNITCKIVEALAEEIVWEGKEAAAKNTGKEDESALWHQNIQESDKAILLYQQAAAQYAQGNKDEVKHLQRAADFILETAKILAEIISKKIIWKVKETEAKNDGREDEVYIWLQAIQESDKAILLYQRAVIQHMQYNQNENLTIESAELIEKMIPQRINWKINEHKSRSDGSIKEANLWYQVIKESDKAILLYQQVAEQGETSEKDNLDLEYAVNFTRRAVQSMAEIMSQRIDWNIKGSEARSHRREEEANLWNQAIQESEKAILLYQQAVKKYVQENDSEEGSGNNLEYAASFTMKTAKVIVEKIFWSAKESEARCHGREKEANLWNQAIQESEKAISLYQQATEQNASKKDMIYYNCASDVAIKTAKVIAKQAETIKAI